MTDRADWHLTNWAEYMQHGTVGRGYPSRSAGMAANARIHTFEDMADQVDEYAAKIVDRIIYDLPARLACAIHNKYLNSVFRFREEPPIDEAISAFWERATKAGLV